MVEVNADNLESQAYNAVKSAGQMDTADYFAVLLVTLGAGAVSKFLQVIVAGYDFSSTVTLGSATTVSVGLIFIIVGMVVTYLTNSFNGFDGLSMIEKAGVATIVVGAVVVVLSPDLLNFITGNYIAGGAYTLLHTAGALGISTQD